MGRLVDANELMWHKSSLVEPRDKTVSMDEVCAYRLGWNDAIDAIIENAPTVDAVPVIRCKDCKHWVNEECNHIGMKGTNIGVSAEMWFCADGERKEDE
jgi:hypothetical protein